MGPPETPRLRPARAVVVVVLGLALVAGVVAVIGHVADYERLRTALERIDPGWLALAVAGKLVAYAGYIVAYGEIAAMRGGPRLGLWETTRIVGIGFGAFVIGSALGGLAVDFWALRQAGCPPHDALRRVLGLNTLQWAALGTFAALAAVAALVWVDGSIPVAMALAWLALVSLCFVGGLWASSPRRIGRLSRIPAAARATRASAWSLLLVLWRWARVGLADAIGGLAFVRLALEHPLRYRKALAGYPLYWAGDLVTLYACLRAFGFELGLAALVLAYATGYVATALPLPVGGAGGVDASFTLSLTAVGMPLAAALLAAVTYRGVSFWLPLVPALALLPTAPALARDLRGVAEARGER
jgi:uncharacterized membrane protein YbhN (UPF0104 family)